MHSRPLVELHPRYSTEFLLLPPVLELGRTAEDRPRGRELHERYRSLDPKQKRLLVLLSADEKIKDRPGLQIKWALTVRVLWKASVCSFGTVCFRFGLSCQGRDTCFSAHQDDFRFASTSWLVVSSRLRPGDLDLSRTVDRISSTFEEGRDNEDAPRPTCISGSVYKPPSEVADIVRPRRWGLDERGIPSS